MNQLSPTSRIYVAGHTGLVGSAILRRLQSDGFTNIVTRPHRAGSSFRNSQFEIRNGHAVAPLDLLDQRAVHDFFRAERPELVFMPAGRVGGIQANAESQADFLYENLVMTANVIHAAAENGVEKLLYLGSSCIYPRDAAQPMREDALLTGPLEQTNEGYAIAKIVGLKLCEKYQRQYGKRFISAMPTNLYGPGDNFHPTGSHVIPGMMRRFHEAKTSGCDEVVVWGSGSPRREFLHVDDLAEALVMLMREYESDQMINVGTGEDVTISELAQMMKKVTGFEGRIVFDTSKPDGPPRKLLDVSRIRARGWSPKIPLEQGLRETCAWAVANAF
jgi:GDP-L-fucose synthase